MKFINEFSQKVLFTTNDIAELYNTDNTKFSALSKYVKENKLSRVKRDLYAAINPKNNDIYANRFEIATKLTDSAYVAYHSAMEYYGLHTQMYTTVFVASDTRFSTFIHEGIDYQRIVSKSQVGVVQKYQNTYLRVTDLERTLIDCIDRIGLAGGIDEVIMAMENVMYLNEKKLIAYLDMYNLKYLYKKAGYLFSNTQGDKLSPEFYQHCKKNMGNSMSYFTENRHMQLKIDNEWNLIVNKYFFNYDEVKDV